MNMNEDTQGTEMEGTAGTTDTGQIEQAAASAQADASGTQESTLGSEAIAAMCWETQRQNADLHGDSSYSTWSFASSSERNAMIELVDTVRADPAAAQTPTEKLIVALLGYAA